MFACQLGCGGELSIAGSERKMTPSSRFRNANGFSNKLKQIH